jgi:predicted permease
MRTLFQDLRYGTRTLRKNPGFTVVAVLTLALGIGANTAIFSILDPLLLRKLPVNSPDELVWVSSAGTLGPAEKGSSEIQSFYTYRDKARVFSGVLAFASVKPYEVTRDGQTLSASGEIVSRNYFTVLGVRPFAGRLFASDGDHGSSGNSIVLSSDYWKRTFNADPNVIGKSLSLNNISYTILGVTPPEFFGAEVGNGPDFYLSLEDRLSDADQWSAQWVTILARLKPELSQAQAEAGLGPLFEQIIRGSSLPEVEKREILARVILTPAGRGLSDLRTHFSLPAQILMAVVGFILLIACANVANLLLARGMGRRREITVRLALGAGRGRIVRQLLTESALLASMGAVIGLLAGRWASGVLVVSLSTARSPIVFTAGLSGRVLLFAVVVLGLTVLICGLAPALSSTRADLAQDLKVQAGDVGRSSSRSRLGKLFLVTQIALSMTLLAGAGLLLRSLVNLETFDVGFDRDHVLAVSMSGHAADRNREQMRAFYEQLLERVRNLPGVRSASYCAFTPISGREIGVNVAVEGYTMRPGETANDLFAPVSPRYFETLGIQLLAGRDFTPHDIQEPYRVAIINSTMARRFFGGASPLGKRFKFVEGNRPSIEIIGVVADSKYNNLRERVSDFFYVPGGAGGVLDVRVNGNAKTLAGPLRDAIHLLDSSVNITSIKTLREQLDESLHQDRLTAALCGAFSLLALTLTCVGLYGALSFGVARRTSEIGVRLALGARPQDIFRLVIGQGMWLTLVGLVLGAAGVLASTSLFESLLFGVKGTDPFTFAAVSLLLVATTILACYVPARRAMRVDPLVALRNE